MRSSIAVLKKLCVSFVGVLAVAGNARAGDATVDGKTSSGSSSPGT